MLHLIKLAVGARDVADLAAWQRERLSQDPPLRHLTRSRPRRTAEIVAGGSLYWVVAGFVQVRQRILDIAEAESPAGQARTALLLHPALVPVAARAQRPFQGWRYLPESDAPPDAAARHEPGTLPPELGAALRELGLL